MAKSIAQLEKIATDKIMNMILPGGVDNKTEGELFNEILGIIQSIIATTGTIFHGVITPSSPGPIQSLTGNLAYISTQGVAGVYRYVNYGSMSVTITEDKTPAIILITRVNGVWSNTVIALNATNSLFRDAYFTVTALNGLTVRIQHGGLPVGASLIIRRKKKNPSCSSKDKRRNQRKWSFLGPRDTPHNRISDLGCYYIDIPRASGVYDVDLTPYLTFVQRTYENGILRGVRLSGNKHAYKHVEESGSNKVYNDLALQMAYPTGSTGKYLNERWRFGEMVRIRYCAQKVWMRGYTDRLHDYISESIVVK